MDMRLLLGAAALYLLTKKKAVAMPEPVRAPAPEVPTYTTPEEIYRAVPEPPVSSPISTPAPIAPTPGIIDIMPACPPGTVRSQLKCVPGFSIMPILPGDGGMIQKPVLPVAPIAEPILPIVKPIVKPIESPIIKPIDSYEQVNLPDAPPLKSQFPAPTDVRPMPMLHWHPLSRSWQAECPHTNSITATILDPATKKAVRVSRDCPMLAFIDQNGNVQMDFNRILSLSIVTRLPDGRVVY